MELGRPPGLIPLHLTAYQEALHGSEEQFHRMTLVQTLHEEVMQADDLEQIVSETLPGVLALDEEGFFLKAGADLLEAELVLHSLNPSPNVDELLVKILENANLKELVSAWKSILTAIASREKPSAGFIQKIWRNSKLRTSRFDRLKRWGCDTCAKMVDRMGFEELSLLLTEDIGPLLGVLHTDTEELDGFLESDELGNMLKSLETRYFLYRTDELTLPFMKLYTHFLGLFVPAKTDFLHVRTIISFLLTLGPGFYVLLQGWRQWFISLYSSIDILDQHAFDPQGIACLAWISTLPNGYNHLHLPCVLSQRSRLQIYLPIANQVFDRCPSLALEIVKYAFDCFSGQEFRTIQTPFLWITEYRQWTVQFLKEVLDLCRDSRLREGQVTALVTQFLSFFSTRVCDM